MYKCNKIHKILNISEIIKLKNVITTHYKKKYNIDKLENIHLTLKNNILTEEEKLFYKNKVALFGKTDRKSCFVKYFYEIFDTDYNILYQYINFIKNEIKPLFPNEKHLIIQKTPNIRFHLSGYSNIGSRETDISKNIIGVHYDGEFGHPESELNFILPLTEMYDTNSIYYEPTVNSKLNYDSYNNLKLKKDHFFQGYLNKCLHYNKINKTDITRVSFDFRIIPFSKYKDTDKLSATNKTKFILGEYYMLI